MVNRIALCCVVSWSLALFMPSPVFAADEGAAIFAQACTLCHTPQRHSLDNKRLTREQWDEAIERMIGYGATVAKNKLPQLLDYLVKMHGPSRANDARSRSRQ